MKPVMVLTGIDGLIKKVELQKILAGIDKKNISVYYLGETEAGVIFSECLHDSLFSDGKVIVVKNAGSVKDRDRKKFEEALDNYIEHINMNIFLIILTDELPPMLEKKIIDKGEIISCRKMYKNELFSYIIKELHRNGISFEKDLPDFIVSLANDDEWETANMLQTLIYFSKEDKTVGIEDARNLLSRATNMNIFDLLDGIFEKDTKKSMLALSDLRRVNETITHINYMIMRNAKMLWSYLSQNKTDANLTMKSYEMRAMKKYSGKSDLKFLSRIFSLASKLEIKAKTLKEEFSFIEIETFLYTMN